MNRDFAEMLSTLIAHGVEFLIVGAHALAAHGVPRATGDLDLWIRPTPQNARQAWKALEEFGAPLTDLTPEDLSTPGMVFQIGVAPARIDVLTQLTGLSFEDAWANRQMISVNDRPLPFLSRSDLVRNKRALGRTRDLADLEALGEK